MEIYNSMQILTDMAQVSESELDVLVGEFHQAVELTANDERLFNSMTSILKEINPYFELEFYSTFKEANVLANVVAGIYAPLIHGFSKTVLKNIDLGILSDVIIAPPRDTIPLVSSLEAMAKVGQQKLTILKPPITRKTAGIANNQSGETAEEDPLFDLLLDQTFGRYCKNGNLLELETGIYSTTSLKVAERLKAKGISQYVALKFYGLGPNVSYIHGLLSGGKEWVAEQAEIDNLVDSNQIANLMVLLDSLEEFGMQNVHQSVGKLQLTPEGWVKPVILSVENRFSEIARATNDAIKKTASTYSAIDTEALNVLLLNSFEKIVALSKAGYPLTLTRPIPPMDNKEEHFEKIRRSHLLDYPRLIL